MADGTTRQPLLSGLLDPLLQPNKRNTEKKRRLHRSRSAPAVDVSLGPAKDGGISPISKYAFGNFRTSFRQVALFLVIYIGIGTLCFYLARRQLNGVKTDGVLDAVYFCIVTMTTVGYGDLVPNSTVTKLLACGFVFSGMAIVALFLSSAADYLIEKQEELLIKALHLRKKASEADVLKEIQTNKIKYKFLTSLGVLLFLILSGTLFLHYVEKLKLVDAFYCVCSTITTLGYGDKSFSTKEGRVFAVFWILTSTICLAQFFLYLTEMYTERRRHKLVQWVLSRRMTVEDIQAADLDNDGVVGAAEFVIYKLKEMGKITEEDIAVVMEQFEALDVDQSGAISNNDLITISIQ